METDFLDAHQRHWDDAERLYNSQRWANADHLYGVSAECGMKRLMIEFGMPLGNRGPAEREDREHIDNLWMRYESYRTGHHRGAGYALSDSNPFQDWHISQRYAPQTRFDQTRTRGHRTAAQSIRALVRKAEQEGLL
ncbi:SAM-dependent methyltransferase [Pseudomonas sp. AL-54]|nr:SAM-dependent methyltransferase [Pseudomonas lopnurensis]